MSGSDGPTGTESKECLVKLGRVGAVVAAGCLSMVLAACGSQLAPGQVAALNNQSATHGRDHDRHDR